MTTYADTWYRSSDGLDLYARDYACTAKNGPGLEVLCMHGLTRNSADFEDLAPRLQDIARVVAVDVRGRGHSQWDTDPANYSPATYTGDMFTLIEHLSLARPVLVGTSMGGVMSMIMGAARPTGFRGVILNDIGPEIDQRGLDRIKGYVGKGVPAMSLDEAISQVAGTNGAAFPGFTRNDWERWVKRMYEARDDGSYVLRYDPAIAAPMQADETAAAPSDMWPLFEAMTSLPVLIIRGEHSDILSGDCAAAMTARHPDCTLVEVAGVGHAPELNEPGVVDAIRRFLKRLG